MPRGVRASRWTIGLVLVCLALTAPAGHAATVLTPTAVDSTNLISDSTTDGSEPELAFDGTNFLMTWYHGSSVKAALVSPNGVIQTPGVITITTTNGYRPSVAFDGSNYLIAWTDLNAASDADREIRAVRVSTAGVVLDDPQRVIGKNAKLRRISVDFDGTNYLAVWRTGGDEIYGGRLSTGGSAQDGDGFAIGTGTHAGFYPQVGFADGQYLVAWHGGNLGAGQDIVGAFVDSAGNAGTPFAIYTGANDQEHVSLATDGSDFLVTWNDGARGNQQNFGGVSAALVAADGAVGTAFDVSDLNWRQGTKQTAAFDGTDYVVAWSEDKFPIKHRLSDVYARRVSTAGAIVDTDPIPVATGFQHQTGPGVGVSGTRYVFVYFDPSCSRFGATCITARLMDRVDVTPPSIVGSPGSATEVGTWERLTSPLDTQIHSVWAFSDDVAFAGVDDDSGPNFASPLLGWNGTSWSNLGYLPNARKYAMWGSAPDRVWMASSFGNIVLWNGTTGTNYHGPFTSISDSLTNMGTAVRGFGQFSLFAAGIDGAVWRSLAYDQAAWDQGHAGTCLTIDGQPYTDYGMADCDHLRGALDNWDLAGNYLDDVYAVGEFGTVGHFDGTDWSVQSVPTQASLNGAYSSCAGDIYAVGDFGTIVHRDNGGAWTRMASPTDEHLTSVAGFGPDDVYAVGNGGTIVHYDGTAWSPEASGTDNTLEDVAVGGSTVWAVGSRDDDWNNVGQGTLLRKQRTLTDATPPENPQLVSHTHRNTDWWPVSTARMHFEGGCDDGEGIDGYSVLFDHDASTVPPETKNLDAGTTNYQETLADGEWYFHIRTVDRAGNWSNAAHHGPIRIDTQAPVNESVTGSDPVPGAWGANDGDIRVDWQWTDNLSGLGGYSYVVDQSPTTDPDTNSIELPGTADGLTVEMVGPGEHWVHVRAIDLSDSGVVGIPAYRPECPNQAPCGNYSATVHIGPFRIDGEPPTDPVLSSRSHTLNQPSDDRSVDIVIGASSDDQSGVDGYSYRWIGGGDHDVDTTKDIEEGTLTVTSEELSDGQWFFAIRAIDNVGNVGATVEIGPFHIGSTSPAPSPSSGAPPPFGPPPLGAPLAAPRIVSLSVTRARIRRRARIVGATRLIDAATVTLKVQRARRGYRVSGRCRPPSARLRKRRTCTRWVTLRGEIEQAFATGRSRFRLRTPATMKLKPGRHRLVAVAESPAGRSDPARAQFEVRRKRH